MNGVRFVPLTCVRCTRDLIGRAVDRLAYCVECGAAMSVMTERLAEVPAYSCAEEYESVVHLPYWRVGKILVPAFFSARPLAMAYFATSAINQWQLKEGVRMDRVPFGARVAVGPAIESTKFSRLDADHVREAQQLLADDSSWISATSVVSVPLQANGMRYRIFGWDADVFCEDVSELDELRERAAELPADPRKRPRESSSSAPTHA